MRRGKIRKSISKEEVDKGFNSSKDFSGKIKYLKLTLKREPFMSEKVKNHVYSLMGDLYMGLVEENNNYINKDNPWFFEKSLYNTNTKGNLTRAHRCYFKAGNKEGLSEVGDQYLSLGNTNMAFSIYEEAGDKEGMVKAGEMDIKDGFVGFAANKFERARSKEGLLKVAEECLEDGEYKYAEEYFKKAGLNEEEISKRMKKRGKLEKSLFGISAIAGFAFSLLFLSSNVTGNIIGNLDFASSNVTGGIVFILSLFLAFLALKK